MDARTGTARRRAAWVVGLLLAAGVGARPAYGQDAGQASASTRVRATDRKATTLLEEGVRSSATFREIVGQLEKSDLLVWVGTQPIKLPGQMQFLAATPTCRHVRVTVRVPGLDNEELAWLAHELWHAVEVAGASDVKDQASLQRLYERIGDGGRFTGVVESTKAQEVWTKVLYEVRAK